jgi:uncharacterized membrane protein
VAITRVAGTLRSFVPAELTIPKDAVVIVLLVAITDTLWLGLPPRLAFLLAPFGLPFLLFAPGYVFVMILFPRGHTAVYEAALGSESEETATQERVFETRPISWKERVALSFGTSVALVPLIGLALTPFVVSLSAIPVLLSVSVFVVAGSVAGTLRRNTVPETERYRVPYGRWFGVLREGLHGREGLLDRAIFGFLLLSILTTAGTMGFSLVAPQNGEAYTGLALLTETADGELVASGYPTDLALGKDQQLVFRVENHEGVETTYTVVVELQRVGWEGDSMTVTEEEALLRMRRTVAADGTWNARHTVAPTMVGEDLRLTYHLYRDEAPQDPDDGDAYRRLYLWVDVSGSSG